MDVLALTVAIWIAISQRMVGHGTVKLSNLTFAFPKEYKGVPINGKIDFSDTNLEGLQSVKLTINDIIVEAEDKYGNNNLCIKNFNIGNVKLSSKYHADMTLMNIIPLYGEGKFSISLEDIKAEVCFKAVSNGADVIKGLKNLKIIMKYRHKPFEIHGFFRNPEADKLVLQFTELLNSFLAMWHNYDPEGASCFFSPLVEFAVNSHMGYEPNTLSFDANKCLWKGTPFGDLGKIQFQTFATLYQDLIKYIKENKME